MKFREIFRFEFVCQVRRVWLWLIFASLIVFAFLLTRNGMLAEALYEDFFLNSPFAIAKTMVIGSLIWLVAGAAVAGAAAARDVGTGMHPLIYTVPLRKLDYLGGRFLTAFVLNALILLALPIGILFAVHAPDVEGAVIGPFRPAAYLTAYGFIALPNAFAATAIQFSFAVHKGRPMASYLGSVLLFFMAYPLVFILISFGQPDLARLLDPIGTMTILDDLSRLWTPTEKNWRLIELKGTLLTNRLLWFGIASAILTTTYLRFRFTHRVGTSWWGRLMRRRNAYSPMTAMTGEPESIPISVPKTRRKFSIGTNACQTLTIAWQSFQNIIKSPGMFIPLAAVAMLLLLFGPDIMAFQGIPLVPTTGQVLKNLISLFSDPPLAVVIPLLTVIYAGELVWTERDAGVSEITDAAPVREWSLFLGKFLGLSLILVLWTLLLAAAGVYIQLLQGYFDVEIGLYLEVLSGTQLINYLLMAMFALVVHVLVNQKYIGHLAVIGTYVFIFNPSLIGIEHNLLIYGAGPQLLYTDMSGFGPSIEPWLWFKLYWAAWALLLAVTARLLWVRGKETGLGVRFRLACRRFTGSTVWTAGATVGLILILGGFIFYNTNVLNEYHTGSEINKLRAEYERRYGQYENIPQPRPVSISLRVAIYPGRREADINGTYELVNYSAVPIDSIHVATEPSDTGEITFDRATKLVLTDENLGYHIYELKEPLLPGDSLQLNFEVHYETHGFSENGIDASVVTNGTYFTSTWLPNIGYQPSRELNEPRARRANGLAQRPLLPSVYEFEAHHDNVEANRDTIRAEGINFEAVVSTDLNQIAAAPGVLRRTWTEDGRRYFHYATNAPIGRFAFFSADYAMRKAKWKDSDGSPEVVSIRIYYHPKHTANLDHMLRSVRASLDYYSEHFGPYPYSYIKLVEVPRSGMGLHAEPSLITFSEGSALLNPEVNLGSLDLPFAVAAHEMAHQWTVDYANVEGAPVMSESLAWYYAMGVVEKTYGRDELQRLLRFMRRPYPYRQIRRGVPLLRAVDPYAAYRKGPFALHALSKYIGKERVNRALRRLVEADHSGASPATTLDLYRELQSVTPDSLQYLLHDLFEVNTFWEFAVEQVTAEQTDTGAWQITLDLEARKLVVDSAGVETEVPMDGWVQIGIFAPAEEGEAELSKLLYVQMRRIDSGAQTITVTVPRKPGLAGIDPYHLLDWEEKEDDNNIERVEIEG